VVKAKTETESDFATTGDQEKHWAEKLFKKEYKKQRHETFKGKVVKLDETTFQFDDIKLEVVNTPSDYLLIFEKGIFSPWTNGLTISDLEELSSLSTSPTIKRFRFSLITNGFSNPTAYFIELTNKKATKATDVRSFIEGSRMTFLKQGWVMI
jgi:hypothetical protein